MLNQDQSREMAAMAPAAWTVGWNDGSGEGLPSLESLQAAPDPQGCACRSRCQAPLGHQER